MMAFSHWSVLSVRVFIVFVGRTLGIRNVYINLSNKSIAMATTSAVRCGNGEKMDLISYSYCKKDCLRGHICVTEHREPLYPEREVLIHEKCSLRERCSGLSFPLQPETQRKISNGVCIKFRCLESTAKFIDLCENKDMSYNEEIHLTTGDFVKYFSRCECHITQAKKNSKIWLTMNDIRLKNIAENNCSIAKLKINSDEISCNDSRLGFGSIFNKRMQEMWFLSVSLSFSTEISTPPDMIWLTIQPEGICGLRSSLLTTTLYTVRSADITGPVKVHCEGHPWSNSGSRARTTTQGRKDNGDEISSCTAVVCGLSGTVVVLIVISIIIYWRRKCRQNGGTKETEHNTNVNAETGVESNSGMNNINTGISAEARRHEITISGEGQYAVPNDGSEIDADLGDIDANAYTEMNSSCGASLDMGSTCTSADKYKDQISISEDRPYPIPCHGYLTAIVLNNVTASAELELTVGAADGATTSSANKSCQDLCISEKRKYSVSKNGYITAIEF